MKPNTLLLATTLRSELAMNTHDGSEANLRCLCDECVTALVEESGLRLVDPARISAAFKELDEAAWSLPIPLKLLSPLERAYVTRFERAKHSIHVLLNEVTQP